MNKTCYRFTQLGAAKYNRSFFLSSSSAVMLVSCLAQGTWRLVAETGVSISSFNVTLLPLSQPVWSSGIIICRSEIWLRWQPRGEKTDIKSEETLSRSAVIAALHNVEPGVESEVVFLYCRLTDSNLTSWSILIAKILGHTLRLATLNITLVKLLDCFCAQDNVLLSWSDKKPSLKIKSWLVAAY